MKVLRFSEKSINIYQSTCRNILKGLESSFHLIFCKYRQAYETSTDHVIHVQTCLLDKHCLSGYPTQQPTACVPTLYKTNKEGYKYM